MTGFIRGLFGGKKDKPAQPSASAGSSFFLEADEAKSLGDLDYMRTPKAIRRTFPKGVQELNTSVSAMKVQDNSSFQQPQSGFTAPSEPTSTGNGGTASGFGTPDANLGTTSRAKTDTSMNMFRDMAKKIRR
jgi:hypothetical protein